MRYIDRTNCRNMHDKGQDKNIKTMGKLTRTATQKAEDLKLGVLKTHWGPYKVIKESGLGAYEDVFDSLAEVDAFIKAI